MTRRRLLWAAGPLLVVVAYLALREYADRARSLEAVLGLSHGDPVVQALVAAAVILLRVACYVTVGGALVAWPLEEWLLARAKKGAAPPSSPAVRPAP
ncbi:MAG: hypothetical protein KIT58_03840 [Planctomycetota bacterium]|nr:hypothetical protein [Planctomycetota bacterium]